MGDGKVMVWLCANKTLFTKMGAGPMDFPGGPEGKTPRPQCWGPQVQSLVRELDPITPGLYACETVSVVDRFICTIF